MQTTNTTTTAPKQDWLTRWTCRINWLDWASHPETKHMWAAMADVRRDRERKARVRRNALNFVLNHRPHHA